MSKSKIYIAGPISGANIEANRKRFFEAEKRVELCGLIPLNPATLPLGMEQSEYMQICMAMLFVADIVMMLDGWESSEGAVVEYKMALKCGKRVVMEKEFHANEQN